MDQGRRSHDVGPRRQRRVRRERRQASWRGRADLPEHGVGTMPGKAKLTCYDCVFWANVPGFSSRPDKLKPLCWLYNKERGEGAAICQHFVPDHFDDVVNRKASRVPYMQVVTAAVCAL